MTTVRASPFHLVFLNESQLGISPLNCHTLFQGSGLRSRLEAPEKYVVFFSAIDLLAQVHQV